MVETIPECLVSAGAPEVGAAGARVGHGHQAVGQTGGSQGSPPFPFKELSSVPSPPGGDEPRGDGGGDPALAPAVVAVDGAH